MKRFIIALGFFLAFSAPAGAQEVDVVVLRAKAANGDVDSAAALGKYYYQTEKNLKKAEKWLDAGAKAGNAEAQYYLAKVYDDSKGGKHPNKEIVEWLEKSATQGYMQAQLMLGKIYQFGRRGIPKDLAKAKQWYDLAAAKGSNEAMQQLQVIYQLSGDEYSKAVLADENVEWLDMGARQGNAEAALNLAMLTEEGRKIPRDYKRAAELYQLAADAGIPQAQAALGKLYANGDGVAQDYQKAVFWLTKASEAGYVEAQRKLASIYAHNLSDPAQAYAWQVISLSAMFPHAADLVKVSPDLERLMRSMTQEQIRDGQVLAAKLVKKIKENKKKQEAEQQNQFRQMQRYQENML